MGQTLKDRYFIQKKIGEGGTGFVYKALDVLLEEEIAIKILRPAWAANDSMVKRFVREIKLARKINHPNVCHIFELGFYDDILFITMQYLRGSGLSELMTSTPPLTFEKRFSIVSGIIAGLRSAHAEKIIHKDLKPGNIIIDKHMRPIILDFGLSRSTVTEIDTHITQKGEIFGTPDYMAPEQFLDETIDHRTDIYALGVILYELFTGSLPFQGETQFKTAFFHINNKPAEPRELNENIPEFLDRAILKCLEKKPDQRYQTVDDLFQDLYFESWGLFPKEQTKTILVADDDENIRLILGKTFETAAYKIIYAQDGEETIQKCLHDKPDLLIVDIMMPKMSGLQVLEFLLSNPTTEQMDIIVISAKTDREFRSYIKSIGIKHFLTKPFNLMKLSDLVDTILLS